MKKSWTKAPAIVGIIIHTIAIVSFLIILILINKNHPPINRGTGLFWFTLDSLFGSLACILYIIDGIFSVIKACMKIDTVFNLILSATIFGSVLSVVLSILIQFYPALIFGLVLFSVCPVLEIISIVRTKKYKKS